MVRLVVSLTVLWHLICRISLCGARTYPSENDFKLVRWIRSPTFLQMEFFTMASGNDLAFPSTRPSNDDREQYRIAESVVELWLQLTTMERVNRIIDDATTEAARNFTDLNAYRGVIKRIFVKIEQYLKTDPRLYEKYEIVASRLNGTSGAPKSNVYFWNSTNEKTILRPQMLTQWLEHPRIRRYAVNGDFLRYCGKPSGSISDAAERDRYVMAQSILELAKNASRMENVQDLYNDALTQTVNQTATEPQFGCRRVKLILFETLAKNFENSSFKEEFESIKKTVNTTIHVE